MARVINHMGTGSYTVSPLTTLKMVTASSIFGEPQYYRKGDLAEKAGGKEIKDGINRSDVVNARRGVLLLNEQNMTTSKIMEKLIDEALDDDFEGTIDWAVELRQGFNMRLNPQIIMVRAAVHPGRQAFTEATGDKFSMAQSLVMKRADEPASQFAYYLSLKGSKKELPSILKRSWARKIERLNRYSMAKYKNAGLGLIDVVRVAHAKGELVSELMSTGSVQFEENEETWETLKSQGKDWSEILERIDIGHMALLRNLRGIFGEIKDTHRAYEILIKLREGVQKGMQFPFRYFNAYQQIQKGVDFRGNRVTIHNKDLVLSTLESCISMSRVNLPSLPGRTISLSDNSGSAWGQFQTEDGQMTVAEMGNLSAVMTAMSAEDGWVGIFGDDVNLYQIDDETKPLEFISKFQHHNHGGVGGRTENGIWLFFRDAIKNKEHWDNIFIYSDMQAGHGGLYGIDPSEYSEFARRSSQTRYAHHGERFIDVAALVEKYRWTVNPKVNVFMVQTAGYENVLIPEYLYRSSILYGWTGREVEFADKINKIWDEADARNGVAALA